MHITVLTLFPEMVRQVISSSMTGRALDKGLFTLDLIQIRDYAVNDYGKVDDYCYGGGTGMLLMAQPVLDAWLDGIKRHYPDAPDASPDQIRIWRHKHQTDCQTYYLSPRGSVYTQNMAITMSKMNHLVLLCGHYEGIDQRVIDLVTDGELSIGDYVLTGGELAACVVMDALLRLVPGVLPNSDAYNQESHMDHILEHAQYTRPSVWLGEEVPDILLSGHQAQITNWKQQQSLYETVKRRPDLLRHHPISASQWQNMLDNWQTVRHAQASKKDHQKNDQHNQ